jgi:hypothetical protein
MQPHELNPVPCLVAFICLLSSMSRREKKHDLNFESLGSHQIKTSHRFVQSSVVNEFIDQT